MFRSIFFSKRYWVSVALLGLGFVVLFSVVEHFMEYGGLAFEIFIQEKLMDGRWIRFVISRLVGGIAYGMIMAYYFEHRKRKVNR